LHHNNWYEQHNDWQSNLKKSGKQE